MVNIFRVTVRGRFVELSSQARAYLGATAADHDLFVSSFTEEGTFTYDERLQFFNLRYEIRSLTADEDPAARAIDEAENFLRVLRIGHGQLRAAVMDMTEMTRRGSASPSE
jgi:Family of unknown function (DUF6204)